MKRILLFIFIFVTTHCIAENSENNFAQEILNTHNKFRELHHASKLSWDENLANFAENYASHCEFKHSGAHNGENLAAGYPTIESAIQSWYNEKENYSYTNPGFSYNTGHFTQLVWKATKKVGCGYVSCDGKNGTPGKFLVCEYSPAGNITNAGYFAKNVLPQD